MRNIQPIQIWHNGQPKEASVLNARIINDDLSSSCVFYYELREANVIIPSTEEGGQETTTSGAKLSDGNITISGDTYNTWDGTNDFAYDYIATQLNLTLVSGSLSV